MTLIIDLDLDVLKMYIRAKSEVPTPMHSNFRTKTGHTYTLLLCDLHLVRMTLVYEIDLDILKMYLHTNKMMFLGQSLRKFELEQQRQTDAHTQTRSNALSAVFAGGNNPIVTRN